MKISVIIPTYQSEKYLVDTLDSIYKQTRQPSELIISDDGSKDATLDIVREFAINSQITTIILAHKKSGISANYLNALYRASGELIIVGDHDDVWKPNKIERIGRVFQACNDVAIVSSDSDIVDSSLTSLGRTLRGGIKKSINISNHVKKNDFLQYLRGLPLDAHTLAFRSDIKKILFAKQMTGVEEIWFEEKVAIASFAIGRLIMIPESLTYYRQHQSQHVGFDGARKAVNSARSPKSRIDRLFLLKDIMEGATSEIRLLDGESCTRRLELLEDFIDFANARLNTGFSFLGLLQLARYFFSGKYMRFTRRGHLSYLKDNYLMFKDALNKREAA